MSSEPSSPHAAHHCPDCGAPVERVPRNAVDFVASLFRSLQRYRCTSCTWEGLLGGVGSEVAAAPRGPVWRTRVLWFVLGAAVALAGVQGARMWRGKVAAKPPHPTMVPIGGAELRSQATPAGVDFDGEPLPPKDERVVENRTPLGLRNSCSWGVPGANRYRGSVEQALVAARLPPEVVKQIAQRAERGWSTEEVAISRDGIHTLDRRRDWGNSMLAMAFGTTLCFNTRVNFAPGHVEYGTLYQAADSRGRNYTVIVPYVCQNVAVLGERAEIEGGPPPNGAPEPASLALTGVALAALAWSARRGAFRRRR